MDSHDSRAAERARLALALAPLFGELLEDHLEEIEERTQRLELSAGELLFRQGERTHSLYIVLHGRLCAELRDSEGRLRIVGECASGEVLGEESLLTDDPHAASIRALRDSVLIRFAYPTFIEFLHTHPTVLWGVTQLVLKRMRLARDGREHRAEVRILAVQFLHDQMDETDRRGFLERLRRALAGHGNAITVDSGAAGATNNAEEKESWLAHWLDELERDHRFILLALDREASLWSKICVRQADRLLLVGRADGDPGVRETEKTLLAEMPEAARASTSLVLLHEENAPDPRGTLPWLEPRTLLRHHHIHVERQAEYERVARFLAHKAVGLVLAGGGAKAFVHIGVYRALHEARVPIDMVGGSSMGSILAGCIAKGWDPEMVLEEARVSFTHKNPIGDYSFLPLVSMMQGRRMRQLIQDKMGMEGIEDLWLNFFCVSGNFTMGEMCVHRRGPLWRAVSASVSLPGILPPVVHEGQLHVDGGTFDNFPVRPMRELGAGRVIACDIELPGRRVLGYEETPSGLRFFWERYVKRNRRWKVPHAMTTMFRSSFLASYERRREAAKLADLYFCSPSSRVGLTQWKALDRAYIAGYTHAKQRLEEVGQEALVDLGAPGDRSTQVD